MKTCLLVVLLFHLVLLTGHTQPRPPDTSPAVTHNANPLTVALKLVDNNYQHTARSRSALILTNTGTEVFARYRLEAVF